MKPAAHRQPAHGLSPFGVEPTGVQSCYTPQDLPTGRSSGPHCPDCEPPELLRPVARGKRLGQHRCPGCLQWWLVSETVPSGCYSISPPPEGTL